MTFSNFTKTALCRAFQGIALIPSVFPEKERDILKGTGSIKKLPVYIKKKGIGSVLVVTDSTVKANGILEPMLEKLDELGIKYRLFSGANVNPTSAIVEKCAQAYADGQCDSIIAVGGGSVMDCAKLASVKTVKPSENLSNAHRLVLLRKTPPVYAVPTTFSTGSESGCIAVCMNKKQKSRNIISSPKLKTAAVVMDSNISGLFSVSSAEQTAMAALCRAVEAYISTVSTKNARENAMLAVKLIFGNIENAHDRDSFAELQKASYIAGSRAGYAHYGALALSAAQRIPYAQAAALLLPNVLKAYGESTHKRLAQLADAVNIKGDTDSEKAAAFICAVEKLNERLGISSKPLHLKGNSVYRLAQTVSRQCNPSYSAPKQLFYSDIVDVFKAV